MKQVNITHRLSWVLTWLSVAAVVMAASSCRTVQKATASSSKDSTAVITTITQLDTQVLETDTAHAVIETWTTTIEEPVLLKDSIVAKRTTKNTHTRTKIASKKLSSRKATEHKKVNQSTRVKSSQKTKHIERKPNASSYMIWIVIILALAAIVYTGKRLHFL